MAFTALYRRAIPAGARIATWVAPDGWSLRRFDWPADGQTRGAILFQGGRGDVFEKYLEVFAHWHAAGWSVSSFDWRGQGGSGRGSADRHIGHIEAFAQYTDDLTAFWATWSQATPGRHVLIGHSMGGYVALQAIVDGGVMPDAAVLVAPMLGLRTPLGARVGERLARLMRRLGPATRRAWRGNERPVTTETRQELLTHDRDRYDDELFWQASKPELLLGPPSWQWIVEAFASTRRLRRSPGLAAIKTPVLMIVPTNDKLVAPRDALGVAARLPDVEVVRFGRESAHEVLRETEAVRRRAIGAIDAFLAARVPA